jgi:hypothetical protein
LFLIDRVERALDSGVDADKFERSAVALLRSRYPSISPVEAGKNMRRDDDIYAVIADDPESRGRVLATTGDPSRISSAVTRALRQVTDVATSARCRRSRIGSVMRMLNRRWISLQVNAIRPGGVGVSVRSVAVRTARSA